MDPELKKAIWQPTMPVWSDKEICAGRDIYGFRSRNAAYEAAKTGGIPAITVGRLKRAVCAAMRKQLGLEDAA